MTSAAEWSGPVGDVWATESRHTDRSFAELSPVLDAAILAAAPDAGRAVDLGCGAGETSIALAAARPGLTVVGADISPELVRIATDRAPSLSNLSFTIADVEREASTVAAGADLLVSRHGVMFYDRPDAVFAALRAAVAPGARLVFSCFRAPALNPWAGALAATVAGAPSPPPPAGAPGPFAFADPDRVAALLAAAGWIAEAPRMVDYAYVAGKGADALDDAVSFFRRIGPVSAVFKAAFDIDRPAMLNRLRAALAGQRDGDRVAFPAAAWIWSAHA